MNYSVTNISNKKPELLLTTEGWSHISIKLFNQIFPKIDHSGNVARIVLDLKFAFLNI